MFVTVTVEHGDAGLAALAAEQIQGIAAESAANSIVIDGRFCPMAPDGRTGADILSELADALDVLAEITELSASAAPTSLMPFGWQSRTRGTLVADSQARHLIHVWPNVVRGSSDSSPQAIVLIDVSAGAETFSAEPQPQEVP
ncbi:hypothetical protein ACIRRA_42925 [Nocardia sp. NPDC101769]|uniref:hypothetical protein n=1 Tax=Nocardia sp. NPDC101769 TaxID=3364333 RepID=UPI0038307EF0